MHAFETRDIVEESPSTHLKRDPMYSEELSEQEALVELQAIGFLLTTDGETDDRLLDDVEGFEGFSEEEREEKAKEHIKLVYFAVARYSDNCIRNPLIQDDIRSAAFLGFAKALQRFDKSRNIKFSTFAMKCMTNEINFCLRKQNRYNMDAHLDAPLAFDKNGNPLDLIDTVPSEERTESQVMTDCDVQLLHQAIQRLDATEQFIIIHIFGLQGERKKTQKEVASLLNPPMSQANVSKRINVITEKLRYLLTTHFHYIP